MISRAFNLVFFMPVNFSGLLVSADFSGFSVSSESASTVQSHFFQTKNNP